MSVLPQGHLPDGHVPEGYLPEGTDEPTYPVVPRSRSLRLPGAGVWIVDPDVLSFCEVIWTDVLPDGVALTSVAYVLPASLTQADAAIDSESGRSAVKIAGAAHASIYQVQMVATLSNGAEIPFTAPLRCFNG